MKASDFLPGDNVIYVPDHAHGDIYNPECEHGIVKRIEGECVFVRYILRGVLQDTAKATPPRNLVIEKPEDETPEMPTRRGRDEDLKAISIGEEITALNKSLRR